MIRDEERIKERICKLKEERNAVILAHNYQLGEIQEIADFRGDSLELSRKAQETKAEVIVFCGVDFMAETAAILNPEKIVLLPDPSAKCPMAAMVNPERLKEERRKNPDAAVVCYVNTSAAVKAESDICCTSANFLQIIENMEAEKIIFVPDWCMGYLASKRTGKKIILYPGYCPAHLRIEPSRIREFRKLHPEAKILVHPECKPEVAELADEVLGTGGMCRYVRESEVREFVIGTEIGMIWRLRMERPDKRFFPLSEQAICPQMKLISLEKVERALERLEPRVEVPEEVRERAEIAIRRMLELPS